MLHVPKEAVIAQRVLKMSLLALHVPGKIDMPGYVVTWLTLFKKSYRGNNMLPVKYAGIKQKT